MRVLSLGMGWFPEEPGGLNRYYYDLARHLSKGGTNLRGLVVGTDLAAQETDGTITAAALPSDSLPRRLWNIRRATKQELDGGTPSDDALTVAHFAQYALPSLDLLKTRPFVVHFHGPWALEGRVEGQSPPQVMAKRVIERIVYQRASRCIVLSQAFADILSRQYRVAEDRIRVIPGAGDVDRYASTLSKEQARDRLGLPKDRPIIVSVRRLMRRMGLEDLIVAMNQVKQRLPEALLLIAGKGPLQPELVRLTESHNLRDNTKLLGFVPESDLPLLYRAADLCVVPTVALEGFGLTTIEALAAGTPVLVTPVGGLPEIVGRLSPDLVLTDTGPDKLAEGIIAALLGTLTLPSAEACQAYVRAEYDWPVVASRIRDVYDEAIRS